MTTTTHEPWCSEHADAPDGGLCATRLTYVDDAGDKVTVTASVGRSDERRVLVDGADMSAREARQLGALLLRAADLADDEGASDMSTSACPAWCTALHHYDGHSGDHHEFDVAGGSVGFWPVWRPGAPAPVFVLALAGPRDEPIDALELDADQLEHLAGLVAKAPPLDVPAAQRS